MSKENYQILQVGEDATDEEIEASYAALKAKYNEERWESGEVGNNAARMLDRLEAAYNEIKSERKEKKQNTSGATAFEEVADLIFDLIGIRILGGNHNFRGFLSQLL